MLSGACDPLNCRFTPFLFRGGGLGGNQRCTGGKFGFHMFHASDRVLKELRGEIRAKQEK